MSTKLGAIQEDVVRLHAIKKGIQTKIDYSYVRMTFESLHLPAGLNALEEIGIPIQTLHRISALLDFPDGAGVDELAEHLRNNEQAWEFMGYVDQSFIRRALGINSM